MADMILATEIGIPRIFDAMEREGLYPPEFKLEAGAMFAVTLRNTVVYRRETLQWLDTLGHLDLNGNQKRLLAYAKERGTTFTSRTYQGLAGMDIYAASRDIKDLIRKGIVKLPKKGGRVYELVGPSDLGVARERPQELVALASILADKGFVTNQDIQGALGISPYSANRVAQRLVASGWLKAQGDKRGRRYIPMA